MALVRRLLDFLVCFNYTSGLVVGTSITFLSERPIKTQSGIGLFFSVFMLGLTAIQARYTPFSPKNSEEFSSASRSVKPGLIASGIVSAVRYSFPHYSRA